MVSCGGSHTLAVSEDGELFSWGFGTMEQLGNGTGEDEEVPIKVKGKAVKQGKVVGIGGGGQHSCVVLGDL
jgi:regulator of chromosome condensation